MLVLNSKNAFEQVERAESGSGTFKSISSNTVNFSMIPNIFGAMARSISY